MNKTLSKYLFYFPATYMRGERVGKYIKLYESLQWADPDVIREYQNKQLINIINHAVNTVPFYRKLYRDIDIKDIHGVDDIKYLPTLSKSDITKDYNLLQSDHKRLFVSSKTTGGSTGQAVTIRKNVDALARERAATWIAYKWAGVDIGEMQARFWGVPITRKARTIHGIIDIISNRMRLSAFNLNDQTLDSYYRKIIQKKPAYFYGYVSMIKEFAQYVQNKNYKPPNNLKCIITTSEVLDDSSRHFIESVFGVKVFNEYGCGEVGSIAHECEMGSMHILSQNMIVEVDRDAASGREDGEILVTDLYNYSMPLIRYRLGDYATLNNEMCACGRVLPVIRKIHGRAYDIIVDPSGNKHHPEVLMYIFEELKSKYPYVEQFQIIQRKLELLEIRLIVGVNYDKGFESKIIELLHQKVHCDIQCKFLYVNKIEREKSGKMRIIKSLIT